MKRFVSRFVSSFLVIISISSVAVNTGNAALVIKPLNKVAAVETDSSGVIAFGDQILVYGNREKSGFVQVVNGPTTELSGDLESFVSAATVDSEGNFYFVGAAATPIVGTLPPISGVLNPDNVMPDPISSNRSDPVNLWFWKLDGTGKLLDSGSMAMPGPVIPNSILVDKSGMTIAGAIYSEPGSQGFIVNWNEKPFLLGKQSTQIFGIVRANDGSVIAVGQSAERLMDKNLKGKADGFLARISNGKLVAVQRSSDPKATRAWRTTNSSLVLGGFSNSQAVITRFNGNFQPTWTDRYAALSGALTATTGKSFYGAFVSNGPVRALPAWKRKGATLLLTLDGKGAITAANYVTTTDFRALTASSTQGAIILAGGFVYRA